MHISSNNIFKVILNYYLSKILFINSNFKVIVFMEIIYNKIRITYKIAYRIV